MADPAETILEALDLVAAEKPWTTQDARAALTAILAENEQLRLERDDFEQRLHAYKSGEHG